MLTNCFSMGDMPLQYMDQEDLAELSCVDLPSSLKDHPTSSYGTLTVIGYKEYILHEGLAVVPAGTRNDIFTLLPRANSNSRCISRTASSSAGGAVFSSINDVSHHSDVFIIGRSTNSSLVDFSLRGYFLKHKDSSGRCTNVDGKSSMHGSVSKFACRLQCERAGDRHRVLIFAGGFDSKQEIHVRKENTIIEKGEVVDGFSTFGVKIFDFPTKRWLEMSVKGKAYSVSSVAPRGKTRLSPPYTNELFDGSLIDVGGIILLYRKPHSLSSLSTRKILPHEIVHQLNIQKPQCPVGMSSLKIRVEDKRKNWTEGLEREGKWDKSGYIEVSNTNTTESDVSLDMHPDAPYIFPACGHVHGYHAALEGKPCPLCRKSGPFTALLYSFEPTICSDTPTHVFNPCGHAASKATAELWASIKYTPIEPGIDPHCSKARCPFCAVLLADAHHGGPFNRVIFHFDGCDQETSHTMDTVESVVDDETSTLFDETDATISAMNTPPPAGGTKIRLPGFRHPALQGPHGLLRYLLRGTTKDN